MTQSDSQVFNPDDGSQELLLAQPMGLPATSTSVKSFHSPTGSFLGLALVTVANETDAERLRREYSGQTIDASSCIPPSFDSALMVLLS